MDSYVTYIVYIFETGKSSPGQINIYRHPGDLQPSWQTEVLVGIDPPVPPGFGPAQSLANYTTLSDQAGAVRATMMSFVYGTTKAGAKGAMASDNGHTYAWQVGQIIPATFNDRVRMTGLRLAQGRG